MSSTLLILSITFAIPQFVTFFICLNYLYEFLKYRKQHLFQKRHSNTTIISCLSWTTVSLFGGLYCLGIGEALPHESRKFFLVPYTLLTPIGTIVLRCRLWLVYFDVHWKESTDQQQWKDLLNLKTSQQNWFIRHKSTYGNPKYVYKWHTLFYMLEVFPFSAIYIAGFSYPSKVYEFTAFGFVLLHVFVSWIFILYIQHKTPAFEDILQILPETKGWIQTVGSFTFSFIVATILGTALTERQNAYLWLIMYFLWSMLFSYGVYIMTKHVLNKLSYVFYNREVSFSSNIISHRLTTTLVESISKNNSLINENNSSNSSDKEIRLSEIISTNSGYDMFMNHLGNEFSRECLLSYTEFTQYQLYLCNLFPKTMDSHKKTLIKFGNNIPLSSIIYDNQNNESNENQSTYNFVNSRIIAWELYNKYIKSGCSLQINISSQLSSQFNGLMSNKELWISNNKYKLMELYKLFQEPKSEMYWLMNHSLSRFLNTKEGQSLVNNLQNKENNV